jgi:hypothetical protein
VRGIRPAVGSAQAAKRGASRAKTGDGPRTWKKAGRGGGVGLPTKNRKEKRIPFSFFFSNISKHFQIILNPLLNLNQTTQYKNSNATA